MGKFFSAGLLALFTLTVILNADDGVIGADQAGNNIGRTAEDDEGSEVELDFSMDRAGAKRLKFTMPFNGEASIGLYTPKNQLVRILGQCIPMAKGEHTLYWDGMDLFGRLVKPGTSLVLKVIHNKPLKATYEMSVAAPKISPFHGTYERDGKKFKGGWLADHSTPNAAAAAGDMVIIGASLAEEGDNIIGVDLKGRKVWGKKLAGWTGTHSILSNGQDVFAMVAKQYGVVQVDPLTGDLKKRFQGPKGSTQWAYDGKDFIFVTPNAVKFYNPFGPATGRGGINFNLSTPAVLSTKAPTEFHISPQAAFGNTFAGGTKNVGNPQNGASPTFKFGNGYLIVAFKKEIPIGSVILSPFQGAEKVEVYTLQSGVVYDPHKHSPISKKSSGASDSSLDMMGEEDDGDDLDMDMSDLFDDFWIKSAESKVGESINVVPLNKPGIKTNAIYFKYLMQSGKKAKGKAKVSMARVMKERFEKVKAKAKVTLHGEIDKAKSKVNGLGWTITSKYPLSGVYPAHAIQDFSKSIEMDGLLLFNPAVRRISIEQLSPSYKGAAAKAPDEAWEPVGRYRGGYVKNLGDLSCSTYANEHYVSFNGRKKVRALRYVFTGGRPKGKWSREGKKPFTAFVEEASPIRLLESPKATDAPTHTLHLVDGKSGKTKKKWSDSAYNLQAMAFDPSGQLFTVKDDRLQKTSFDRSSGKLQHDQLSDENLDNAVRLTATGDRLAVGSRGRAAVILFDHSGSKKLTIGDKGEVTRGPWDPSKLRSKVYGIAIASDDSIWVAESNFSPKRVARFDAKGNFMEEFIGNPMYGGGGWVDQDLKSFYYRGMEWALDWEKGTSHLANLPDRNYTQETPIHGASSFNYTGVSKPFYYEGKRYIVGGTTILRKPGLLWEPAVVMGYALGNSFLLKKDVWNKHWGKFDLEGKRFIWCDANGDGLYQVEEVELYDPKAKGVDDRALATLAMGNDFSFWSKGLRWKPRTITSKGVPIFKSEDIEAFDYDTLAPHYPRNYTLAGKTSAKPTYTGFKYITAKGRLIQEGQPYIVEPDGTIMGGAPDMKPSEYIPPVFGRVLHTPWGYSGGAVTKSEIGEVVHSYSMNGYQFIWAADYGMVVGHVLNGSDGGWKYIEPVRGMDVTGKKFAWEGWFGGFMQAHNGNYYLQGGKSHHSISRVEGLDDYKVLEIPFTVDGDSHRRNKKYRPVKVAMSRSGAGSREALFFKSLETRTRNYKLDGHVEDWGKEHTFDPLGDEKFGVKVAAATSDDGLHLAFRGKGDVKNHAKDWKKVFMGGFGIDIQWRADRRGRGSLPIEGDQRIIIVKLGKTWTPIHYDYVNPEKRKNRVIYSSDFMDTPIDHIRQMGKDEIQFIVKDGVLEFDLDDLNGEDDGMDGGLMDDMMGGDDLMGGGDKAKAENDDEGTWTAEVLIPWKTLGYFNKGRKKRIDVGIIRPDGEGGVKDRLYRCNPHPLPTVEAGIAAAISPISYGVLTAQEH